MNERLRILMIEDNATDAAIVERALHRDGVESRTQVAATRSEVAAALRRVWDVVFIDYTVPGLPGEEALAMVREHAPEVPVIFVTGTIGEDRAVELIRRGATDYVLKDGLDRLAMATRRAVAEVADRRERERLEEELRAAQRLESVGRLAGGMAHDLNNILQAADGFAQLVADEIGPGSTAADDLAEVRRSLERAASLTEHLLAFARRQILNLDAVDVRTLLADLTPTIETLVGDTITVVTSCRRGTAPALADRTQLERVIVNLVVNARDAMPDGGRLEIEARNAAEGTVPPAHEARSAPGGYVEIVVSDTGTGMTRDVLDHLFEPYFTTKEVGKGSGLGLATAHGIVHQSSGWIEVDSALGHGSSFRVYLPEATLGALPGPGPAAAAAPVTGNGRRALVAVVDDTVRTYIRRALEEHGFSVGAVGTPDDALHAPGPVDLIVADMTMPGTHGPELVARLAARLGSVPVLYLAADAVDALVDRAMAPGHVLTAPYSIDRLLEAVRVALSPSGAAAPLDDHAGHGSGSVTPSAGGEGG